ncbi:hypothetical protein B0J12DRAFT_740486 [Macrophomina phaseolina]|uniref:AA1-like domain-containing protein n=1 Tax=Macrophomina phaseolina TaxID=35725 RepID=A0ABQ8GAT1_9PEZI|nr:hypothetical protein B0J12DRAFT_740486 [Macrophomina phaseolina]
MKFFAATAAFAGLAAAAKITDATIRDNNGIQMAQFTVDGVQCTASDAQLGSRQIACPGSAYSWHINGANSEYTLTLFKGVTSDAAGAYGKIPVVCTAGGNGPNDKVCDQTSEVTIDI